MSFVMYLLLLIIIISLYTCCSSCVFENKQYFAYSFDFETLQQVEWQKALYEISQSGFNTLDLEIGIENHANKPYQDDTLGSIIKIMVDCNFECYIVTFNLDFQDLCQNNHQEKAVLQNIAYIYDWVLDTLIHTIRISGKSEFKLTNKFIFRFKESKSLDTFRALAIFRERVNEHLAFTLLFNVIVILFPIGYLNSKRDKPLETLPGYKLQFYDKFDSGTRNDDIKWFYYHVKANGSLLLQHNYERELARFIRKYTDVSIIFYCSHFDYNALRQFSKPLRLLPTTIDSDKTLIPKIPLLSSNVEMFETKVLVMEKMIPFPRLLKAIANNVMRPIKLPNLGSFFSSNGKPTWPEHMGQAHSRILIYCKTKIFKNHPVDQNFKEIEKSYRLKIVGKTTGTYVTIIVDENLISLERLVVEPSSKQFSLDRTVMREPRRIHINYEICLITDVRINCLSDPSFGLVANVSVDDDDHVVTSNSSVTTTWNVFPLGFSEQFNEILLNLYDQWWSTTSPSTSKQHRWPSNSLLLDYTMHVMFGPGIFYARLFVSPDKYEVWNSLFHANNRFGGGVYLDMSSFHYGSITVNGKFLGTYDKKNRQTVYLPFLFLTSGWNTFAIYEEYLCPEIIPIIERPISTDLTYRNLFRLLDQ